LLKLRPRECKDERVIQIINDLKSGDVFCHYSFLVAGFPQVQKFQLFFQTEEPPVCVLYDELADRIKCIMAFFMKKSSYEDVYGYQLPNVDPIDKENHQSLEKKIRW